MTQKNTTEPRRQFTLRLPPDIDLILTVHAHQQGTSKQEIVTRALQLYLTKQGGLPDLQKKLQNPTLFD